MPNKTIIPPDIADLFKSIGTSLNAICGESPDQCELGEPWRSQLLEIKGQINASLKDLPATDQVPAAQEASYGLNFLKSQLLSVQSIINSLTAVVKAKTQQVAQATASLEPSIQTAIDGKIKAGELFTKEAHDTAVSSARSEGETAGLAKGKLRSDRLMALASASLDPSIVSITPDSVLTGEDSAFTAAKDAAITRVQKLAGIGITVASMGNLPWASEETFNADFTRFSQIHEQMKKGQSNNAAPAAPADKKPAVTAPSPFAGAGQSSKTQKPFLC